MFAPSTAFTEVTGLPVWAAIIATGFVCLFYTTIGCIETGGILNAWKLTEQSGRVEFFDFNPDPTVRHTFWTLIVGNFFSWLANYSVDQQMIQRYASTKSLKHATIALLVNVPGIFIMITLSSLLGVVIYGYYAPMKCDPLKSGRVTDPNQLAPRFVMDIFQFAPGIPGLYIASLFAGSLSSVSSMLNALATVVWEDIFKLFRPAREASDKTATIATKLLCVVFAGSGMGMAYVFSHVGGTILQMSIAFNGAANAPIVGMFMLGLFFPWANWIGALVGAVLGFAFPMWISIGASVTKPPIYRPMYYDVECCGFIPDNSTSSYFSSTTDVYTNLTTTVPEVSGITRLYMLSYLWNMGLGILITVVVGLIVSFLTGHTKPKDVNPKLLIPYVDTFWCCFPESCRSKLRCGIDYSKVDDSDSIEENENQDKSVDLFQNIISVHPEVEADLDEDENKSTTVGASTKVVTISSDESRVSRENSMNYMITHRNGGSSSSTLVCLNGMEITKL